MDRRAYPLTAHLPPRKDGQPRTLGPMGLPLWRVTFTDRFGVRQVVLVEKSTQRWARTWASRMAAVHHWALPIVVGRWFGADPAAPAPHRIEPYAGDAVPVA